LQIAIPDYVIVKLSLKNPAPEDDSRQRWGDFHFGNALKRALEGKGVRVFQDFWPNWTADHGEDVVLVLRGLRQYQPPRAKFKVLWIISHPAMVSSREIANYDLILTASAFHLGLLREITRKPVEVARQCTDFEGFSPAAGSLSEEAQRREGIVYVANSRGKRREMAQWIEETQTPVRVFGRAWEKFDIGKLVEQEYLPNSDLPNLYRSARLGLNDHWEDMRRFGFINNRVFDSLACGLPVLTDVFPEIQTYFGSALLYASNAEEFKEKINFCEANYEEVLGRVRESWNSLGAQHSFEVRAEELIGWINQPPAPASKDGAPGDWAGHGQLFYRVLRTSIDQEEKKTAYLEKLISERSRQADQAEKDLAWVRERREEERRQKEEARRKAEQGQREVTTLTERLHSEQQAKDQLENRLKKEETRLKEEKIKNEELLRYAERLREQLQGVYSSRSWKISVPYRIVARTVQGWLRGEKVGRARIPDWPASVSLAELDDKRDDNSGYGPGEEKEKRGAISANDFKPENFEPPVFADHLFGPKNTDTKLEMACQCNPGRTLFNLKRLTAFTGYRLGRSVLPLRRRLGLAARYILGDRWLRMRAKASAGAGRKDPDKSLMSMGSAPSAMGRLQEQPLSPGGLNVLENEIEAWSAWAIQLLEKLEAVRSDAIADFYLLPPEPSPKNGRLKRVGPSGKAEAMSNPELEAHLKDQLQYWKTQALQFYEELMYARANRAKNE